MIIFCITCSRLFWVIIKKHETFANNPSVKIYINIVENRILSWIKSVYYLEHLRPGAKIK